MISTNAFKIQTTAGCFVNFVQEMIKWEFCHNETNLYGKKRGFDWWMDWCENLVCTYIDRFVIPSSLWRDSNNSSVTILELIWVKFGFLMSLGHIIYCEKWSLGDRPECSFSILQFAPWVSANSVAKCLMFI